MPRNDTEIKVATNQVVIRDWAGPNDGTNPQNWVLPKKLYHSIIPTSIAFLCPFGSSVYTPGRNQVAAQFGCSREVALLPFCLYLLGLSFGPVLAGPTSETFGRRWVYLVGLPLFSLFTVGAGFSQNITTLTICRFFAGLFSSPGLSLGAGTISDVWRPEKKGLPMAVFITGVQMSPALGPVVGSFLTVEKTWRWTQWVILFGAAIAMTLTLGMSETYKAQILKSQARKLNARGPHGDESTLKTLKLFARKTIIRPLHMLLTEPIVACFGIYVSMGFGLLNAFFAAFPYVFEEVYSFDLTSIGLTFLGQAVGSVIALVIIVIFDKAYYQPRSRCFRERDSIGALPPEQRLWIAMFGAPMLPVSLFWFGWTARPGIHWISPVGAEALFSCGNLLIFSCSLLYLTDAYGAVYGASASSSNTFLRYLFATVIPLFAEQMYRGLGIGWASSLLGFITVALMPIPFLFYVWGPRLRRNSSYNPNQ